MADRKSCEDIDECQSHGVCHQNCENVKGSFKCSCADGFRLENDRRTCKVIGMLLIYSFLFVCWFHIWSNEHFCVCRL